MHNKKLQKLSRQSKKYQRKKQQLVEARRNQNSN